MKNVVLRPMEPEDLGLLYQIETERFAWAVSSSGIPYSRYALKQYLAAQPEDIFQSSELRLTIQHLDTGDPVGVADLYAYDPVSRKAEVGIAILKKEQRKGYAIQALAELEKIARLKLHVHQLYAYVKCSNEQSLHLFHSAGFSLTATLADWLYDEGSYHDVCLLQKIIEKNP